MNRQGFTLIELLIIIAIIGILAAIGLVNYTRWRASSTVMEGAQQFAQAVANTRTGAKRANACWQIRIVGAAPFANATQYEVRHFNTATCTGTPTSEQSYSMPAGTRLSLAGGDNNVNFSPPYATTDSSPNSYNVTWSANSSISRAVRITSILGKVVVK